MLEPGNLQTAGIWIGTDNSLPVTIQYCEQIEKSYESHRSNYDDNMEYSDNWIEC